MVLTCFFLVCCRSAVLQEIEMEEKRRKWHLDQLLEVQKKLEALPVSDTVS